MTNLPESREFCVLGDRQFVTMVGPAVLRRLEAKADARIVASLNRNVSPDKPFEVLAGAEVVSLWLGDRLVSTTKW